jgi:hypothetical protein
MDSPYRMGELDVIQCHGRDDRRCAPFGVTCAAGSRKRRWGERITVAFAWASGVSLLVAAALGIAGGARACALLADMKPNPVLLKCAAPPPPKKHAHDAPPPPAAPPVKPPTLYDLPPVTLFAAADAKGAGMDTVRALALSAAGAPVKVQLVGIPKDVLRTGLGFNVNATPISRAPGLPAEGVELATIPKGSILERAGLLQGDVVLTVNGYNAAQPTWIDHVRAEPGAATVVELLRAKQRVMLVVEWLPASR